MNKLMFKVTEKISYKLDEMAMHIVKDGAEYESHKTLFNMLDKTSVWVYNTGYNKWILGAK